MVIVLKDNADEESYDTYLSEWGLKNLIKKYSNYVRYPIQMECDKTRELPKPEDAGDDYKPEFEHYTETETINSMIPIWKRSKSDVTEEEYNEFYKSDFHDFADPVRTIKVHATMRSCSSPAARRMICTARTSRRAWRSTAPTS